MERGGFAGDPLASGSVPPKRDTAAPIKAARAMSQHRPQPGSTSAKLVADGPAERSDTLRGNSAAVPADVCIGFVHQVETAFASRCPGTDRAREQHADTGTSTRLPVAQTAASDDSANSSGRPDIEASATKAQVNVPSTGLEPVAYPLGDSVRPSMPCAPVR
jgi:hypothetical protein